MLYIVDGTGPLFNDEYHIEMAGSHCRIVNHLNKGSSFYYRGPSLESVIKPTGDIAKTVFHRVMQEEFPSALLGPGERQSPRSPIFLVGHSRGGAAVVKVAKMLGEKGIYVDGLFLFDAVDMTVFLSGVEIVPWNVRKCFHAIRNEGAEIVLAHETEVLWKKCKEAEGFADLQKEFLRIGSGSFDQFLKLRSASHAARWPALSQAVRAWSLKSVAYGRMKVAMRNSYGVTSTTEGPKWSVPFGNCATKFDPKCKWEMAEFACSHGAVGGTPWMTLGPEIEQLENAGARQVWAWMSGRMKQFGINAGKVS